MLLSGNQTMVTYTDPGVRIIQASSRRTHRSQRFSRCICQVTKVPTGLQSR